ncbi:VWA domain-containing protein [Propionimicrobium lymphophilum]|uniref:VWA domain-containing protein n=1 Tax=Propionimicrobium lymphophilum TaxID=33012 RepID=UPI0023F25C8F|nr:VWA domain-containing protein [Propionimicrobium lymphophilum]
MEFLNPSRLGWLALVAVLAMAYLLVSVKSGRKSRESFGGAVPRQSGLKRHLSVIACLLSVATLVIAWAQPLGVHQVPRQRATVVVAIDVSHSMRAQDVTPSRIESAKSSAKEFVDLLPQGFNVSLVLFAGDIELQTVPTTDRSSVKASIDAAQMAPSTAIGEGIYSALDSLRFAPPNPDDPEEPVPAAIVLLSDGYTNVGRKSADAAAAAKSQGVPVYTIAFGTPGGYVRENGQRLPVPVDHAELATVANISGGKKYSAESSSDLKSVYETLAISLGYDEEKVEITERYAGIAAIFALLAAAGVISLAARWP